MLIPDHPFRGAARAVTALLAATSMLLIGLPAAASPDGTNDPEVLSPATIAQAMEIASSMGETSLRLLVELDVDTEAGGVGPLSAQNARAAIAQEAALVTEVLETARFEVIRSFETVPYLAVSAGADDLADLLAIPGIVSVVPDEVVELHLDQSVAQIGAADPVATYAGEPLDGSGIAIAIIDTGVETDHPFIGARVVTEACFSSGGNCPDGGIEETGPGTGQPLAGGDHGTHVAGIALGAGTGSPDRGVAPAADLVAIQAFSLTDDGQRVSYISDLTKSLEFVLAHHTDDNGSEVAAVNLSLGTVPQSPCNGTGAWTVFANVASILRTAGVVTVAASGNSRSRDAMGAPACLPEVLSVAAVDGAGDLASFSDVSEDTDVVAPGVGIVSSVPGGTFGSKSGTSMAAPHAAGAAALLRAAAPHAGADTIEGALRESLHLIDDDRGAATLSDGTELPAGAVEGLPLLDLPKASTALPGAPGAPGAPTEVTANAENLRATVSWSAPTGGPAVETYHVVSRPDGVTCTASAPDTTSASAPSCVVEGLRNGTEYTFTVIARNSAGPGPSSAPSEAAMPQLGPPAAPTDVTVRATKGAATVSWTAAFPGENPVVGYEVISEPASNGCTVSAEENGTIPTACEITGLLQDTSYAFTVIATDDEDRKSPASEPSNTVVPNGRPDPPTDATAQAGNGEVTVSWTPPGWDGGFNVTSYEVTSTPHSDGCTVVGSEQPPTQCNVTGLSNGAIYTFRIIATNLNGPSPASAPTPETVPGTVPDPPRNVVAASNEGGEATITWEAPASDGGAAILSYRVVATSSAGTGGSCDAGPATLTCTITGLTEGASYTFAATATNDRGTSEPSTASAPVTIMAAPTGAGGGGGGGAGGAGGGGGDLPPPEEEDGAGADQPAPVTNPDGSLPSQPPGIWTLLLDGEPVEATITDSGSSVTVSGEGFSLALSALTSDGGATGPTEGISLQLSAGGRVGVAFAGLAGSSTLNGWLFSEPALLGTSSATAAGDVDTAWQVPPDTSRGAHTLQVNGTLADGRFVTFNLGIEVEVAISFPDVDPDATHGQAILRLAQLGIVTGFSDGTFGPALPVNRGQMASFLQRALELEPGESGAFPDTAGGTHDLAIAAITEADIATGFQDGTYRPDEPVTRGQMATFLANAVDLVEAPDGPFIDIDGNVHAGRINAVTAAGIAEGFDDDTYRPGRDITRAQMASLISRMLDHLADAA